MKLGEVLNSKIRWLKGSAFNSLYPGSSCLGYALCIVRGLQWGSDKTDASEVSKGWADRRMMRLIDAHFPERASPEIYRHSPIVEFNNHPDTTREEIDKLVRLWDDEVEAGIPEEGF